MGEPLSQPPTKGISWLIAQAVPGKCLKPGSQLLPTLFSRCPPTPRGKELEAWLALLQDPEVQNAQGTKCAFFSSMLEAKVSPPTPIRITGLRNKALEGSLEVWYHHTHTLPPELRINLKITL